MVFVTASERVNELELKGNSLIRQRAAGAETVCVDGWACLIACYPGALLQGHRVTASCLIMLSQNQSLITSEFIRFGKDPPPLLQWLQLDYENAGTLLKPRSNHTPAELSSKALSVSQCPLMVGYLQWKENKLYSVSFGQAQFFFSNQSAAQNKTEATTLGLLSLTVSVHTFRSLFPRSKFHFPNKLR